MPLLMFYVVVVGEVGQEQRHVDVEGHVDVVVDVDVVVVVVVDVDMDMEWQPQLMMMTTSPMMT